MSISILSNRTVDFLDDINAKYASLECEIEQKLASICSDEKKFEKTYSTKRVTFEDKSNKSCTDLESAKRRNAELIKELEISKARYDLELRTVLWSKSLKRPSITMQIIHTYRNQRFEENLAQRTCKSKLNGKM